MRRLAITIVTLAATTAAYSQSPPPPATKVIPKKPEAAKPKTIRNPNWTPKPGDRAEVVIDDAPAFQDDSAYAYFMKLSEAKDRVGIEKAVGGGSIVKVPRGVHVLVIQSHRPQRVVSGPRIQSTESYLDSIQAAAFAPKDTTVYPLEVRFEDGPLKDMLRFVPENCIAQMITAPQTPPTRVKAKRKTFQGGTPASRAVEAYRAARKLEAEGKTAEAIAAYKALSTSIFPEGKLATARVKVLEGK